MRFWPDTLAGRTSLLLVSSVLLLVIISAPLLFDERRAAFLAQQHTRLVERLVSLYRLLDISDADQQAAITERYANQGMELNIQERPLLHHGRPRHPLEGLLHRKLRRELPGIGRGGIRIRAVTEHDDDEQHFRRPPEIEQLHINLRLSDRRWLNITVHDFIQAPPWAKPTLLWLLLLLLVIGAMGYWSSRRLSQPMRQLADAAERFGRGQPVEQLPETGPREVRESVRAFNQMQERLQRNLRDRSLMLAAVSHDLRTPITTLRLRAEYIEDAEMRERTLATLAHMESIVSDTLAFARDESAEQQSRRFDLAALLQTLCDDYRDTGQDVRCELPDKLAIEGRPAALQRAISNLVENALRYAGSASLSITNDPKQVAIHVDDDGPGIPDDKLEEAFTPFFRLETSRNSETGGIGLGLAIARLLVHAHGGSLSLQNKPSGGLRATITLPRSTA